MGRFGRPLLRRKVRFHAAIPQIGECEPQPIRDNVAIMGIDQRQTSGRNDPCPCGSGKKYKRCCLTGTSAPSTTLESPWSRQREASDRLTPALLKLAARELGEDLLLAWADFNQVEFPEPISKFENEECIFNPYLMFDWDPDAPQRRSGKPRAGLVLGTYLDKHADRLSLLEMQIVIQAISQPVSFYEVVRCNQGRSAVLRDVLIGEETEVEEHSATKWMRPGDLAYGQIWKLPEVATIGRLGPRLIRPDQKLEILELRAKLRKKVAKKNRDLNSEDLLRYREEIRTVYLDIRDAALRPKKLTNTDGEPFVLHKLTFRIGSAQLAFDALASLAWSIDKETLLEEAGRDAKGSLVSIEFAWLGKGNKLHKDWETTVLGHLKISGHTLVVDVNSENRAKRIRKEIEKRLGLHATHLSTTTETIELDPTKLSTKGQSAIPKAGAGIPPLTPEMQKEFAAYVQEQVEAWIHQNVPALGGRTPLEAVGDPDGREMVEALLLGWERHFEGPAAPGSIKPDIDAVRRLLNLPVAIGTVIH